MLTDNGIVEAVDCDFVNDAGEGSVGCIHCENVKNISLVGCTFVMEKVEQATAATICFQNKPEYCSFERCEFRGDCVHLRSKAGLITVT